MKEFISIFLLILATLVGKGQETRNHHSGSQVESGQDVGTALTSPLESPLPTPLPTDPPPPVPYSEPTKEDSTPILAPTIPARTYPVIQHRAPQSTQQKKSGHD